MAQKNVDCQNNTNKQRLVKVPVRVHPETIDELRAMYEDEETRISIRMVKIGAWKYPCMICLLPAGQVAGFKKLQQNEAKQEQREARCWLSDGSGGYVRCPEENKCCRCERIRAFSFDTNHPTSFEALQDFYDAGQEICYWTGEEASAMKEPSAGEEEQTEEVSTEIMQILVNRLTAIRPKYGAIFREMLKGNLRPFTIAKALGLGKSQVHDDVPKVQELAKRIYFELIGE